MGNIEVTREGHGSHRAGHVWTLRIGGTYRGTFETKRQALDSARDAFAADLGNLTAGMSVTRYANDDDEFNYVVSQMEDLGHDRDAAHAALAQWITDTPTWDCPNCNLENIEVAGFAYCPNCDEANPDVVWTSIDGKQN